MHAAHMLLLPSTAVMRRCIAQERLAHARALVERLGVKTHQLEPDSEAAEPEAAL